jgi:hypothetical protein
LLSKRIIQETLPLLLLTLTGFLAMGYHPGFEDDGIYLTAIKADLNPALYPHDSDFFRLQMQASAFDGGMAHFVRWTGIPVAWAALLWQFAALYFILWACRRIAAQIFEQARAQWAAVAMVAAMFTLPVAGTALNIADQHLHPRNLATALILIAVAWMLEGKRWLAVPALLAAFLLHPIMAALGMSFCVFLGLALLEPVPFRMRAAEGSMAAAAPLGWLFAPTNSSWRLALESKSYYSLWRWEWYEWLGALAPLFLFWLLWRVAQKGAGSYSAGAKTPLDSIALLPGMNPRPTAWTSFFAGAKARVDFGLLSARLKSCPDTEPSLRLPSLNLPSLRLPPLKLPSLKLDDGGNSAACQERLARFGLAVFAYGVFQQIVAMALLTPESLVRLTPLQPMRYLQLVYVFMALVAGGLLGRFVLKRQAWRWAVYLLVFNGGMFLVQWELIDDGAHLEMPWRSTANPWLQAFDWIRLNTPNDAYFALDPHYLAAPGEGFHGFRALAERSALSDDIKDTSVVTEVPSLAPVWHEQQLALAGWPHFQLGDFERLKAQFGVDWVIVNAQQAAGLECRWHGGSLSICEVP